VTTDQGRRNWQLLIGGAAISPWNAPLGLLFDQLLIVSLRPPTRLTTCRSSGIITSPCSSQQVLQRHCSPFQKKYTSTTTFVWEIVRSILLLRQSSFLYLSGCCFCIVFISAQHLTIRSFLSSNTDDWHPALIDPVEFDYPRLLSYDVVVTNTPIRYSLWARTRLHLVVPPGDLPNEKFFTSGVHHLPTKSPQVL
jgi:hypothetical protein